MYIESINKYANIKIKINMFVWEKIIRKESLCLVNEQN